jgi:Tfp pilus assembly protein PilN
MQALRINLLGLPARPSALGWLLLIAGVLAFAVAWWDHSDASAEQAVVQTRSSQKAPAPRARTAPASVAAGEAQALQMRQVAMAQLSLPWAQWLGALEALPGRGVALLALDLQGDAATVRLTAEARDMRQALAYLSALRASPEVASAELSTHEQVRVGEAEVLRFTIDVRWRAMP